MQEPVFLSDLVRGDLFYIEGPKPNERGRYYKKPQLTIMLTTLGRHDKEILTMYIGGNEDGRIEYIPRGKILSLQTFRAPQSDYMRPDVQKIQKQLFPRYKVPIIIRGPNHIRQLIEQGRNLFYFWEEGDRYILGRIESVEDFGLGLGLDGILPSAADITYRVMDGPHGPEGDLQRTTIYGSPFVKHNIFEYSPPLSRQNVLKRGTAILEREGEEKGMATIRELLGKAAVHERAPLLLAWKRARGEDAAEAAAGGGGGGEGRSAVPPTPSLLGEGDRKNNNTTKGGRMRKRPRKTKRRRQ